MIPLAKSSKEEYSVQVLDLKKVILTHETKTQPLKMIILILSMETHNSQVTQFNFLANVKKFFINPAKNV